MDFCFTIDEPRKKEKRKEITECFRLLEKCEKESTIAKTGLEQLKGILKRWKLNCPEKPNQDRRVATDDMEEPRETVGVLWEQAEIPMYQPSSAPKPKSTEVTDELTTVEREAEENFLDPLACFQDLFDPNAWLESMDFDLNLSNSDWDEILRQVEGYDAIS